MAEQGQNDGDQRYRCHFYLDLSQQNVLLFRILHYLSNQKAQGVSYAL